MKENLTILPVALSALLLFMGASLAQPDKEPLGAGDESFLKNASMNLIMLIGLGKMAVKNAASLEVKNFGEKTADTHTVLYRDLVQLGKRKGMKLPGEMDEKHREAVRPFSGLRNAEFDREFMSFLEDTLEKEVSIFAKAARECADPDVKAFARNNLPVIEVNLKLAKKTLAGIPRPTLK